MRADDCWVEATQRSCAMHGDDAASWPQGVEAHGWRRRSASLEGVSAHAGTGGRYWRRDRHLGMMCTDPMSSSRARPQGARIAISAVFLACGITVGAWASQLPRIKEALGSKAVSQQDFDDADATLKQADADLETARINLAYTKITAPIAGRIGKSSVTDGAIVTAYQPVPLATIQQMDPIYVDVPQSTADLLRFERRLADGRLTRDQANPNAVQLILENGAVYPAEGTLQFRDVSVDSSTATVILRMVFPNPTEMLLPGMFVRAVVKEGHTDHAILIPQQAVLRDPKGNPLALIVNSAGTVELRLLTLDRAIGDKWLVTAGLAPGDRVVVEGLQRAQPGAAVKVVPFEAAATPAARPARAGPARAVARFTRFMRISHAAHETRAGCGTVLSLPGSYPTI